MKDLEKIEKLICENELLWSEQSMADSRRFIIWYNKTEDFIVQKYGEDSFRHNKFKNISFRDLDDEAITGSHLSWKTYRNGLEEAKSMLKIFWEEETEKNKDEHLQDQSHQFNYKKVFIVHGHDGELKEAVARIIEKQSIEAVVLSEKANQGKTIIEKFEENSDVGAAICLFTKDDIGKAKAGKEQPRARQNVVFEAGYFMGKLGRDHTVLIYEDGVELPSDLNGMVYTNKEGYEFKLLKELKEMGYDIDPNKQL